MKKLYVFILFVCACAIGFHAHAQAVITFDKTTIDLGSFTPEKPVSCTFEFTNTGDKPLVIHQAFSSCGCTVPQYPKNPIQPGQRGILKVTYDGKGKFPGPFTKPISVRSNASNNLVRVYIKGNMTGKK